MTQTSTGGPRVQSLARAFEVLERLADAGGTSSLSELATDTGLAPATIHRLIQSLVAGGYVRQEPSRRYALGPRLIRIGEIATLLRLVGHPVPRGARRAERRDREHGDARG